VCHSYSCTYLLSLTVQQDAPTGTGLIDRVERGRTTHVHSSMFHEFVSKCLSRAILCSGRSKWDKYSMYDVHKKVKFTLEQGWSYRCTLSIISVLDGDGWSMSWPAHFNLEKETQYQLNKRLDGPQGRFGQVSKISPPPGFDPWTVQLRWVAIPITLSCSMFIIVTVFHWYFNRFHASFTHFLTAYCLNIIPVVCILVNIKRLGCESV